MVRSPATDGLSARVAVGAEDDSEAPVQIHVIPARRFGIELKSPLLTVTTSSFKTVSTVSTVSNARSSKAWRAFASLNRC
jgi:hypothetical protein